MTFDRRAANPRAATLGAATLGVAAAGMAIAAAAPSPAGAWETGEPYTVSMAGSAPAHSIYAISVAHKRLLEEALEGVRVDVLATQGGAENIELLMIGEANLANGNSIAAYSAHHGAFVFDGMGDSGILGLFPGYTWEIGAVVPADSEAETFRDLLGQSIAIGPVGSGAEATVSAALEALDLSDDDFANVQRSSPQQAFASLAAGTADAVVWGTAHPAGLYLESQSTQDLRYIPFSQDDMRTITEALPFYHDGALRAGTYDGQDDAVRWIGGSTHFWVDAEVPDDLVRAMVEVMWENREALADAHVSQRFLDADLVRQQASLVPFHPGARRYFVEQGILED